MSFEGIPLRGTVGWPPYRQLNNTAGNWRKQFTDSKSFCRELHPVKTCIESSLKYKKRRRGMTGMVYQLNDQPNVDRVSNSLLRSD